MQNLFHGIFDSELTTVIEPGQFLLCIFLSLLGGVLLSVLYGLAARLSHERSTRGFLVTLCTLPAIVCVVIMMVNGNIGVGVAVAGAFGWIRFRSAPGTAKEIGALFLAMGAGLIAGMGYLAYALLFVLVMGLFLLVLALIPAKGETEKQLLIVIPENLSYTGLFEDLFEKYTLSHRLTAVRTSGLGTLFKLTYAVRMKDEALEKEFIDALRCRNGNLEISICEKETFTNEL